MVIEVEIGKDFVFVYVPRLPETRGLLRKLNALKAPTADYWRDWNEYTKTYFKSGLNDYEPRNCIGHSWTFNTPLVRKKLERLLDGVPVEYKIEQ